MNWGILWVQNVFYLSGWRWMGNISGNPRSDRPCPLSPISGVNTSLLSSALTCWQLDIYKHLQLAHAAGNAIESGTHHPEACQFHHARSHQRFFSPDHRTPGIVAPRKQLSPRAFVVHIKSAELILASWSIYLIASHSWWIQLWSS